MASIKGRLFEFFVYRLLVACGFKPVAPDGLLVYKGGPGLMVQGCGQPHNADVLLSPPIQTPFYYPTRLLVECKCYNQPIGLPQVRNALGLRDDINDFEIVTEDILKNRKANRSNAPKYYPMKRYVYQVAVASIDGFTKTAFPFAQAHRIPLISFAHSALFTNIRDAITALDRIASRNNDLSQQIDSRLSGVMLHPERNVSTDSFDCDEWRTYIEEIELIAHRVTIGLLEDGTLLFLLQAGQAVNELYHSDMRDDGCTIHWYPGDDSTWVLNNHGIVYHFELPKEIYHQWVRTEGEQRRDALRIKRDYFSKIVLFHKPDRGTENISVVQLSERFMDSAEQSLRNQNNT